MVAVVGGAPDKPSVVIVTTAGARDRRLSGRATWSGLASETLGGRGGGKDDIAQGGGSDGSQAGAALTAVEHAIGHTPAVVRRRACGSPGLG